MRDWNSRPIEDDVLSAANLIAPSEIHLSVNIDEEELRSRSVAFWSAKRGFGRRLRKLRLKWIMSIFRLVVPALRIGYDPSAFSGLNIQKSLAILSKDQNATAKRLLAIEVSLLNVLKSKHEVVATQPEPGSIQGKKGDDTKAETNVVQFAAFDDVHLHLVGGPYGRFMVLAPDLIGGAIERGEFWDSHLRDVIQKYADPSGIAIDAGAHIGFISVYLSKHFHEVIAFEPQKVLFGLLGTNILLNNCGNVHARNQCLFSRSATMAVAAAERQQIMIPRIGGRIDYGTIGNSAALSFEEVAVAVQEQVSGISLDSLNLDKVSFIKIDAQGGDFDVIQGAKETILKYKPAIVFEFEGSLAVHNGKNLADFEVLFKEMGYIISKIRDHGNNQVDYLALPSA